MNKQIFFVIEDNLKPLQMILRGLRHSAFITYDEEIGLPPQSKDVEIIECVAQQKKDLGIDRIIITRDSKNFISEIGKNNIKVIVLIDKTNSWGLYNMRLKQLSQEIILIATKMIEITSGQSIQYIDCSKFYKK